MDRFNVNRIFERLCEVNMLANIQLQKEDKKVLRFFYYFWCRGYYVDTVGKNAKKIQEYIANQLQRDLEYDQMTLKEYIDSFTGDSVKRNK